MLFLDVSFIMPTFGKNQTFCHWPLCAAVTCECCIEPSEEHREHPMSDDITPGNPIGLSGGNYVYDFDRTIFSDRSFI